MLDHIRALDPRELLREVLAASVEDRVDNVLRLPGLESVILDIAPEQLLGSALLLECLGVQLNYLERHNLRPSEVHIEAAVVVCEEVGVAIAVAAQLANLLPLSLPGVGGVIDVLVVH